MNYRRILAGTVMSILTVQTLAIAVPQDAWQRFIPTVYAADFSATLTKTGSATVAPGEFIEYTVHVTNNEGAQQTGVTISDTVPSGLSLVTGGSSAGCTQVGSTVTCAAQDFAAQQSRDYTLKFLVPLTATCDSSISNTVNVQQNSTTIATTNSVSTQVQCAAQAIADLSLTSTPSPTSVERGGNVTLTFVAHNNGPSAVTDAKIVDTLPAGYQFVGAAGTTCTVNGSTVECPIGSLASGADKQVQLILSTPTDANCTGPTSASNQANVTSSLADNASSNNVAIANFSLTCSTPNQTNISVENEAPATIARGNNLTYTIGVYNHGPAPAVNVIMREPVPGGLTFVSSDNGVPCVLISGNTQIECTLGTMAVNTEKEFHVTYSVPTIANCQQSQAFATAYVYTDTPDPTGSDDLDQAVTTLTCPAVNTTADLSIVKTGETSIVNGTQQITYTLTATNNGSTAVEEVHIRDFYPTQLTFVSATDTDNRCHAVQGQREIDCGYGYTIAAGQSKTVQLTFSVTSVSPCAPFSFQNNSSVEGEYNSDSNSANNTSNVVTNVTCPQTGTPDLKVTKTASPTSIVRGQNVEFTLVVQNTGGAAATDVVLRDPLQGGLTYVSANGATCSLTGSTVLCPLGTVNAGDTKTVKIIATTPTVQTCSTSSIVYNTAYVSSTSIDANPADNQSQITVTLTCPATNGTVDLRVQKIAEPAIVNRGDQMIFQFIITNLGTATATNVVARDPLQGGLTYVSATGATCTSANSEVSCQVGSVAPGEIKYVYVTVQTPAQPQCTGALIYNTVFVTSDQIDTNPGNNQSQVTISLVCSGIRFTITKSIGGLTTTTAQRGDILTYTVTVTNLGVATNGVSLVDNVPANTEFVSESSTHGCTFNTANNAVNCPPENYASGQVKVYTLKFKVLDTAACGAIIMNYADIQIDDDSFLWSNYVRTDIICPSADLGIVKTGAATVTAGTNVVYTISVTNTGPGTASGVIVNDVIPAGMGYVSSANGANTTGVTCTAGTTIQCSLGSIAPGQTKQFTLTFSIPSTATCSQQFQNTATVQGSVTDPNSANNSSTAVSTVSCNTTDVGVVKTGASTVTAGNQIVYTISVTNNGTGTASGVTVSDIIPTGLSYVSFANGAGTTGVTCTAGTTIQCSLGNMTAGQNKQLTLTFLVASTATCNQQFTNTATVQSASTDSNSANNTSSVQTTVTCTTTNTADVSITKAGPATAIPGSQLSYTLIVTNAGPATATNVTVSDPFPSQLQYVSSTVSPNTNASCTVSGTQLSCSLGNLNSGETRNITLTFNIPTSIQACAYITNMASVTTTATDSNFSNNQSQTISTQMRCDTYNPNPPPPPRYRDVEPVVVYQVQYQAQTQTQTAPEVVYNGVMPQTGAMDDFYAPFGDGSAYLRPFQGAAAGGATGMMGILTMLGMIGAGAAGALKASRMFL